LPPRLVFLILISRRVERQVVTVLSQANPGRGALQQLRVHLGLEWVYEEALPSYRPKRGGERQARGIILFNSGLRADTEAPLLQESLVAPPAEEIAALFDLAMMGDLRSIVERTTRLEQLDKKWIPCHPFASISQRL